MRLRFATWLWVGIVSWSGLLAQSNDSLSTYQLEPLVVVPLRVDAAMGLRSFYATDSITRLRFQSTDVGRLLQEETHAFIKDYGPGNTATISLRGSGAGHTAVLWNGLNIQSPGLGLSDFSTLPVFIADSLLLQYGGASSDFGSGAIGGALQLFSNPNREQGFIVNGFADWGSFARQAYGLSLAYSTSRITTRVKGYYQKAQNDYPYPNTAKEGKPKEYQQNADQANAGVLADLFFQPKKKNATQQMISFHFWYQEGERGMPGTMLEVSTYHRYATSALRSVGVWQIKKGRSTAMLRGGLATEQLNYSDTLKNVDSKSESFSPQVEWEYAYRINPRLRLVSGIQGLWTAMRQTNFDRQAYLPQYALWMSWHGYFLKTKGHIQFNLRQASIGETWAPLMPSLSLGYQLNKGITLKGSVFKAYRHPSLNDWYWQPGGNSALKPEQGLGADMQCAIRKSLAKHTQLGLRINAYTSSIEDWILWVPGPSYWSPQNIQSVWARGIELEPSVTWKFSQRSVMLSLRYSYTRSTQLESENPDFVGKQLIYVPIYQAGGTLHFFHKESLFTIHGNYVGNRYNTPDNASVVDAFFTVDLRFSQRFYRGKSSLYVECLNLFNQEYQVVQWQAMPGRNYRLGLTFLLHTKPKQRVL